MGYTMCSPCAVGCETCLSANETDCLTCSAGFTVDKTPKPAPAPEAAKEEGSEGKRRKTKTPRKRKDRRQFLAWMSTSALSNQTCARSASTAQTPRDLTSANLKRRRKKLPRKRRLPKPRKAKRRR